MTFVRSPVSGAVIFGSSDAPRPAAADLDGFDNFRTVQTLFLHATGQQGRKRYDTRMCTLEVVLRSDREGSALPHELNPNDPISMALLLLPVRQNTDLTTAMSLDLVHPAGTECPFSHLQAPRDKYDPCCGFRALVLQDELSIFREDLLALSLNCSKSPPKSQRFAEELYDSAAQIEQDHVGRLEERLGARRGGTIDAETGLVHPGPRSTVGEALKLIRLAGDWFQEAAQLGFNVEVRYCR